MCVPVHVVGMGMRRSSCAVTFGGASDAVCGNFYFGHFGIRCRHAGGLAELKALGFDQLNNGNLAYEIGQIADEAAREAAEAAFQEVVESLEGATIEQIEQATGSTHISTTSCGEGCTEETFY